MPTNNAEGMNFKVVHTGNSIVDGRKPSNLRPLTLASIDVFIEEKVTDQRVREEVKKLVRAYPQQALWSFKKNIQTHIARAQKKLKNIPLIKPELGETPADIDNIRDINDEFS